MPKNKKIENRLKDKIENLCWYWICYADGLAEKDRRKYVKAMADDIMSLLLREKYEKKTKSRVGKNLIKK